MPQKGFTSTITIISVLIIIGIVGGIIYLMTQYDLNRGGPYSSMPQEAAYSEEIFNESSDSANPVNE